MRTHLLIFATLLVSPAFGQEESSEATPAQATPAPFQAPTPDEDGFDWIQLTSGEWLKGELLRIRDGKLEFDSDELDELTLDWDDVKFVRSSRHVTVSIEGWEEPFEGTLLIENGEVILGGDPAVGGVADQRFEREALLAVIPGNGKWQDLWSGKASIGLGFRRGNTTQTDYTSYMFARRETVKTRWDSTYNGAFAKVSGVETANNHRFSSQYDYFLTRRLFVTPVSLGIYRDPFSNVAVRYTPAAGFGYDLIDKNTFDWEIGGGPAYQYTEFDSVQSGEPTTDSTVAAYFGTTVNWDITPDVEMNFTYNITAPIPETDEFNHHLATTLSLDFYGNLDFDVTLIWDRINKPPIDAEGNEPKPDDLRLTMGIGFDF